MSLRRARIKASASHLASLAGKRRVNNQESDEKAKEVSDPKPSPVVEEKPSEETTTSSQIIEANVENISVTEDTLKEPNLNEEIIPNQPASPAQIGSNSTLPPRPLLKSRFRPNLSESDQQRTRLRRISGCEVAASPGTSGRVRTISGSSDDFNVGSPGLVQSLFLICLNIAR